MSSRFAVYDSEAVDLIIVAIPVDDGRAEEDFVTVSPSGDFFGEEQSADGHVVRYNKHMRLWNVEVKLKRSSSCNAKFAALLAIDVASTNGAGVGAFLLKDRNGSTLMLGSQCWIKKSPDMKFGTSVGEVSWMFTVVSDAKKMIAGGN